MLKVFRDNLKNLKWVLWVVIVVFVVGLAAGYGTLENDPSTATWAAKVGSHEISFREYRRQYQLLQDNARRAYGEAFTQELATQLGLPRQAMDSLIAQRILLDEALRLGLKSTDTEVQRTIGATSVFQDENGNFVGMDAYTRVLLANQYTRAEYETLVRNQLIMDKLTAALSETIYVSAAEVEKSFREGAERASIRYLQLAKEPFRDEVTVETAELQEYFDSHRSQFQLPEKRSVGYLLVNVHDFELSMDVPEEDLQAYYEENKEQRYTRQEQVRARHILLFADDENPRDKVLAQLQDIRQRVEAGEDFGELARQFSQDEETRQRGGDLGLLRRGQRNPAFEEAAFGADAGTLVGPVETSLINRTGFHLIDVIDHQPGGVTEFDEVKNQIKSLLLSQRAREAAEAKAQRLYERAQEDSLGTEEELRALAAEEGVAFEVTEPFPRSGNVPTIGRDTPFSTAAFGLAPGEVAQPVRVPAGWAVVSVKEVVAPRLPELAEVEVEVRQAVVDEKGLEIAHQRLEQARKEVEGGKSLEDVAGDLGVVVQDSNEFGPRGSVPGLGKEVVDAAFALEQGDLGGPLTTPNGPVLFQVADRQHWDRTEFEANEEATREQLERQRLNLLQISLVEKRRLELEATYNPRLTELFQQGSLQF